MPPLMALVISVLLAVGRPPADVPAGYLIWHINSRSDTLVAVYRDGGRVAVQVSPTHLYQQVSFATISADGRETVVVRYWQVDYDAPSAPATGWGLRDIEALTSYFRLEFEWIGASGDTMTVKSGPSGYLVRLITRHAITESNVSN